MKLPILTRNATITPMPRIVKTLVLTVAAVVFTHAHGQVMQNTNYEQELRHAMSLIAGMTSTDIPHHIHYDLKLYDRDGRESTATYDIYRDPIMYQRIEMKAGSFELTHISNVRDKKEWLQYTGEEPV